ncbi:FAD/NAD(P)-binding domain-containing protein [Aureobasidium pullulans]|nr:FAD/NAD(P)-binding domain-containing protein [Aureobasidium pullulans]
MTAGVTGLVIAHGLQKAGIPCKIFDHEPNASARPREWTMGLHWALPLLKSLLPDQLASRISEAYVDSFLDWTQSPLDRMRMYNGLTGDIMKDIPIKGQIVRVSRRKLRTFLTEGTDVKYGHSLTDIHYNADNTITAIFANGATETGSLVVGADGPRSAVRGLLLSEEEASVKPLENVIHTNITFCPQEKEKALFLRSAHPAWSICLHPDLFCMLSVQDTPAEDPTTWSFQLVSGWLGSRSSFPTSSSRITELKRRGNLLCEPFKSAFECLDENLDCRYEELSCWETQEWDCQNGRVALAGDAAHAMPPHRGQGLNHAIQDAYNLVNILTKHYAPSSTSSDLTSELQSYANEVSIRGAEEVRLTKQNAYMVLDWKLLEQSPVFKHALDRSPVVNKEEGKEVETAQNEVTAMAGA